MRRSGNLLTIKDQATHDVLMSKDHLGKVSDSHTIILGIQKRGSEWTWVTGMVLDKVFFIDVVSEILLVRPPSGPTQCGLTNESVFNSVH